MHLRLFLPAAPSHAGGGHAYDRQLLAGLRAEGHEAEVVPLAGTHPLPDPAAFAAAAAAWAACRAETKVLIDGLALAAFEPLADALAARGAAVLVHHPTALPPGHDEADHARLRAAEQRLLPRLPRVVATSETTARLLGDAFGVEPTRLAVLPPGFGAARRSPGSGGPACHILSIGALTPRKGHDILLHALARLFDLPWHLTLVGTPDRHPAHAAALHALATELGIAGQVTFAGVPEDTALEALWDRTDLFALATHWEANAWATMQAFRHGVPAVLTEGGAAAAAITLQNGIVVPPGEAALLSRALRRAIFDTRLRAALAEAAWETGRALPGWPEQARRLVALLPTPA